MTPRERVILVVSGLGALGGAIAGAAAALLATLVIKPVDPVTIGSMAAMVVTYGVVTGVAGAVLGTTVAFGFLRRVRLSRVLTFCSSGAFLGLALGWIGGPWAWHHFGTLGIGGLLAGALAARVLTRSPEIEGSIDRQPLPGHLQGHELSGSGDEIQRHQASAPAQSHDDLLKVTRRSRQRD